MGGDAGFVPSALQGMVKDMDDKKGES